jgi:transposase-like protein
MKMMPMGDYYVWHCDWCDSTNYTIWTRVDREGFTCAACHQQFSELAERSHLFSQQHAPENRIHRFSL